MHIESLTLTDWRGYQDATVEMNETGLVVIAGANNAGKTALLGAFDVAAGRDVSPGMRRSGTQAAHIRVAFRLSDSEIEAFAARTTDPVGYIEHDSFRQVVFDWVDHDDRQMYLRKVTTNVGDRPVTIGEVVSIDAGNQSVAHVVNWDWLYGAPAAVVHDPAKEIVWHQRNGPIDVLFNPPYLLGRLSSLWEQWRDDCLHFNSVRPGTQRSRPLGSAVQLEPSGVNLPDALLGLKTNREHEWELLKDVMHEALPELGQLVVRTDTDVRVGFVDPSTGVEFNLKDLGTGVEQVLMTAFAGIAQPTGGMIIIEEPEGSLHPAAQRHVVGRLREWSEKRCIVVSTHSPILVDSAGQGVLAVSRSNGVSSIAPVGNRAEHALEELGVRLSDVLSAERLLMVEGPSDKDILDTWFGPRLEAAGTVTLITNGSDATWLLPTVQAAFEAADQVGRRLLVLRDRDDLADHTLEKLREHAAMCVLRRREIENYLLDPDAIYEVLKQRGVASPPDPVELGTTLVSLADDLRAAVQLRRVAEHFAPIRLFDRSWKRQVIETPSRQAMLDRVHEVIPDASALARDVSSAWQQEGEWLEERWNTERLNLCAGADLLDRLWQVHGLRYQKRRDGPLLARAGEPPEELSLAIDRLIEDGSDEGPR